MKKLHKLLLWFAMLSKRLYKKPTFLILMVLIPLLVVGYTAISGGESGVLTIGLACEKDDPLAQEIFSDLQTSSQLISFRIYDTPQEAEALLRGGKLDAVWIFSGDIAERIEAFSQKPSASNAFIQVLEREDNIALMLSRERLNGTIYPYVAQRVYVHFLRDLAPELDHLSDAQLLEYYEAVDLSTKLFDYANAASQQQHESFLLSPLRGLLGALILLCSLAAGMYYTRDLEAGTFAWINRKWLFLPEFGCQMTASLHIGIVCAICLSFCGLAASVWLELAILLLYSLCCSVFAMLLRQLCGSVKRLGAVLPLLILVVLVVCPVFFDLGFLRTAQYFLPPTYYINAPYNLRYLGYMAGYTAGLAGITIAVQYTKYRLARH